MVSRARRLVLPLVALAALVGAAGTLAGHDGGRDWPTIGHNADRLAPRWVATTNGDVSATPAVVDGAVYFGDFGGTLWKLDADTGETIWSHSVPDYTGIAGDYARTSPSLTGDTLVVGVIRGPNPAGAFGPNVLGI